MGMPATMLYFAGVIPEVNGEWLPFSWKNVSEAIDIYYNYGYLESYAPGHSKTGVLLCGTNIRGKNGPDDQFSH